MQSVKSYTALDVGKFLCALLILCYHFFSEKGSAPVLLEEALSLYAVAVALFMTISGFLTFRKVDQLDTFDARWGYVKKQVKRIFQIYLLWSIPYLLFTVLRWDYATITPSFLLWKVQGWIFRTTFSTIWFLPSLGTGILLAFFAIEKLPKKVWIPLAVLMYFLSALTGTYSFAGEAIPGFDGVLAFFKTWAENRCGLLFAFPLVLLGRCVTRKRTSLGWKGWAVLSVLSTAGLLAEALTLRHFAGNTGIDNTLMMIPTAFCILQFLLCFPLPEGGYAVMMRKMSVLIFVTQRLFLTVLPAMLPQTVMDRILANSVVGALALCGGTIVFSAAIILLSGKIKWLKNLY